MSIQIPFDNSYSRLPQRFFARQAPVPVQAPALIAVNNGLAARLGLDAAALASPDGVAVLAGNAVPQGADPLAQAYAGHQFGGWNPQLGDGRAVLLGEIVAPDGERFDIALKGAGQTPFSRRGDGRAWLGPVIREYLVSEAMAALAVPTTRALAATTTGETVWRETGLPGAVLTRVAASHIRVGTFQYFASRDDTEGLKALTDHVIARHYPQAAGPLALIAAVSARQARLVARWMSLGFIHGVMNTDNMAISGETIDYGPCAFMDGYHPDTVFSSIDAYGRYAYSNQPQIALWNLAQFASCLLPLMGEPSNAVEDATAALKAFSGIYQAEWLRLFSAKVGITDVRPEDRDLIEALLSLMAADRADFTRVFRGLVDGQARDEFVDRDSFDAWNGKRLERVRSEPDPEDVMTKANPWIIARNHRVEEAIQSAVAGDFGPFHRLNAALADPFAVRTDYSDLTRAPAESEMVTRTFCGT